MKWTVISQPLIALHWSNRSFGGALANFYLYIFICKMHRIVFQRIWINICMFFITHRNKRYGDSIGGYCVPIVPCIYKLCSESLLNSFFGIIPSSKDDFVSNPIDSHNVKVKAGGIISFKDTRSLPRNKTQKSLSSDNIIAFYFGIWFCQR